ncbi:MAG TPA: radical SAM protein [Oligoflexus sp.]|uniref:B12-binding domain-containing radical SAM protein n=1 Tax=Oligoflexus sp. TaxID=1971216 RepID=UPI002D804BB2|nr:radical SAM protein [Oligoflexus sp.]HET9235758.1 radical SAM protein [Oligoflexus sp.]
MTSPRILLLTPPMTQLNTPYPATAYLTGFLQMHGYAVEQRDPAIELLLALLSRHGLMEIKAELDANFEDVPYEERPEEVQLFLENFPAYLNTVEPTLRFLQGKDPSLAIRLCSRQYLPEAIGFAGLHQMEEIEGAEHLGHAFGSLGTQDKGKYLASLYVAGLVSVINAGIDPRFELSRYGERLAASNPSFDDLHDSIEGQETFVDDVQKSIILGYLNDTKPDVVGITLPFPGNVYAGFKIAQTVKQWNPEVRVLMGGGYVNTELRGLKDPRVFNYVDYITVDDGERPLLNLLEHLSGQRPENELMRTYQRKDGRVLYWDSKKTHDIPHKDTGTPTYRGLPLDSYLSICEMPNPMHRIWSDGRWNKITLAHGCYWNKCSFCDVSLDYIARYDEAHADIILARMEALIAETGQTGFHFVDEAAPPKVLLALANRIIEKGLTVTWWGNIRFEKTFTPKVAKILAASGCIAVSGGLEVASDRLLKLMNKGVTVEQVARVTRALTDAGILVHAYLMYGFPTQTKKETVEALEYVRQLFQAGCIQSGYWHRFAATVHSPVGKNPEQFGIRLLPYDDIQFASNDIEFEDPTPCDHEVLGEGLKRALYNYMHGMGLNEPLHIWFDQPIPKPKVSADYIAAALHQVH